MNSPQSAAPALSPSPPMTWQVWLGRYLGIQAIMVGVYLLASAVLTPHIFTWSESGPGAIALQGCMGPLILALIFLGSNPAAPLIAGGACLLILPGLFLQARRWILLPILWVLSQPVFLFIALRIWSD